VISPRSKSSSGMAAPGLWTRVRGRLERKGARLFFGRPRAAWTDAPIVSFTFDDFPLSAFPEADPVLSRTVG
jgi:peptidoglycan/xylan/chitin deacetylase (PgdA/CDA1 family)